MRLLVLVGVGVPLALMDWNPQVLCWNVRGLNNPAKRNAVREFVVAAKVNLVCLQETKLVAFDPFLVIQCMDHPLMVLPTYRHWILVVESY